jgi:hypothetical protein
MAKELPSPDPKRFPIRWAVAFAVLAALVAFGAYAARSGLFRKSIDRSSEWLENAVAEADSGANGPAYVSRDFNYRFVFPGPEWRKDDFLKVAVKANSLALARSAPDAWMALATKDYKTTDPDVGQLTDEAVQRLAGYFETLEFEAKGDGDLGGHKARRLVFQGKVKDRLMSGECYLLAHKGIAYWFTTWTTAEAAGRQPQQIAAEFQRLRNGFSLGHARDAWTGRVPANTFVGRRAAYELREVPPPWKEWPEPQSLDERGDLLLVAADPDEPKDISRNATALVLLLDKPADLAAAVAAARAYVEAQHRQTFQTAKLSVSRDRELPVGAVPGRVVELRALDGETRERFVALAVVLHKDLERLVVIQCECDWKRRTRWEPAFQELLAKFQLRKTRPSGGR